MVDFTDLIPAQPAAPATPSVSFDDLIPSEPTAPSASPVAEKDPFEGEGATSLLKRRGQQAASGATESIASVPEGLELLRRQNTRQVNESANEATLGLEKERTELEAILTEMRPKAEAGDWEAGARVKAAEMRLTNVLGQLQMAGRMESDTAASLAIPVEAKPGFKVGEGIREAVGEVVGKPDERDQSFWGKLAYGAGNVAGMAGTALATGVVGGPVAAIAAGAAQGSTMNSSQIYKEAIEAGVDEEAALEASNLGLIVGATEIIPLSRALKIVGGGQASSTFMRKAIEIAKNAGEEGLQEFLAQVANNFIAQGYYDPERGTFQGAGEAAAIGAILGGATGSVGQMINRGDRDDREAVTVGEVAPDAQAALNPAPDALNPAPDAPAAAAPQGTTTAPPEVSPDAQAALDEALPGIKSPAERVREVMGRAAATAPAEPATAAPTVTPEVTTPETAGDTLETVPEAPATIENQNTALLDPKNKRKAVFIPNSSYEAGNVDEPEGKTIGRVVLNEGVLFYNKAKGYTANDVRTLYKTGRLGTVLGLGDFTKADAAASVARGNPEVAVTERAPDGTEVKAAVGTTETAPDQVAALEASKTDGNTVQVESPTKILSDRLAQVQAPAAAPVQQAAPQDPTTPNPFPPASPEAEEIAKLNSALAQNAARAATTIPEPEAVQPPAAPEAPVDRAQKVRENAIRALEPELKVLGFPVDAVLAMPRGEQQKLVERAKKARASASTKVVSDAPKAEKAKLVSKAKEPKVSEQPKTVEQGPPKATAPVTVVDEKTGKRQIILPVDAETQAMIAAQEKANDEQIGQNFAAMKKASKADRVRLKEASAAERRAKRQNISDAVAEKKLKRGAREAVARIGVEDTKDRKRAITKVGNAVRAQKLMDEKGTKKVELVATKDDVQRVRDRLNAILAEADSRGITIPTRTNDSVSDAVVWLQDVKMMADKLNTSSRLSPDIVQDWIVDEAVMVSGDSRPTRARRASVGDERMNTRKIGGDTLDNVADTSNSSLDEMYDAEAAENKDENAVEVARVTEKDVDLPANASEEERAKALAKAKSDAKVAAALDTIGRDDQDNAARPSSSGRAPVKLSDSTEKAEVKFKTEKGKTVAKKVERAQGGETRTLADMSEEERKAKIAEAAAKYGAQPTARAFKEDDTQDAEYDIVAEIAILTDDLDDTLTPEGKLGVVALASATDFGLNPAVPSNPNEDTAVQYQRLGRIERAIHRAMGTDPSTPFEPHIATFDGSFRGILESAMYDSEGLEALVEVVYPDIAPGVLTKVVGALGKKLAEVVGDVRVHIVEDAIFDMLGDGVAYYNPDGDIVVMRRSYFDAPISNLSTIVHEAAHAAFSRLIKSDPELRKWINELRKVTRARMDSLPDESGEFRGRYWDTNEDEFISEMFGNPRFIEFLANTPLPRITALKLWNAKLWTPEMKANKLRTVFDAIKATLSNILGLDAILKPAIPGGPASVFDAAMDLSAAMLERSAQARADAGFTSGVIRFNEAQDDVKKADEKASAALFQRLRKRGLNPRQAAKVASVIRDEFGGKATDAQLDEIADLIKGDMDLAQKLTKAANAQGKKLKAKAEKAQQEALKQAIAEFTPNNPGRPRALLLKLLTGAQIGRVADRFFGKENNPVRKIVELIERRRVRRDRYVSEMGKVLEDMATALDKFPEPVQEMFYEMVHDATMADVHPDVPLDHPRNKHLGKNAMRGVYAKEVHPELAMAYKALPPELQEIYAKTRDALMDAQSRMSYGVMRNILRAVGITDEAVVKRFHEDAATEADYAMVTEEVAHHLKKATELHKVRGPYFPLMRRGEYVVSGFYKITPPSNGVAIEPNVIEFKTRKEAEAYVSQLAKKPTKERLRADLDSVWVDEQTGKTYGIERDGTEVRISKSDGVQRFRVTVQNQHTEFVDNRAAAKKLTALLKEGGMDEVYFEKKKWERDAQNAEMLSDQHRSLMATLDKRGTTKNLTPSQKAELKGMLNEVSLRFLGSTRIQASRLPRRYVNGASKDVLRNTHDYIKEAAGYIAKLDTQPDLEQAMKDLDARHEALRKSGTGANEGSRIIVDEISQRALDPDYSNSDGAFKRAVDRLLQVAFIAYLMSPAYSVINGVGGATMAFNVLAGEYGAGRAAYHMIKAYYDLGAVRILGKGTVEAVKGLAAVTSEGNYIDGMKGRLKDSQEAAMLQELADVGLIDGTAGLEIARRLDRAGSVAGQALDIGLGYLDNIARAVPQAIEAINRGPNALAAYRLARGASKTHEQAVQFAKDAIDRSQGNYSATNAPPMFNNQFGRVSLQFKKYGQMIYAELAYNIYRSLHGETAGDRWRARRTLAMIVATQSVVAGSMGLPLLELARVVFMGAVAAGLKEEDWDDFEEDVLAFWTELFGNETAGEMATFGVTRGIPGGWGIDLNSRMGMQSLLTFGEPKSGKENDLKAWLFDLAAGAGVSAAGDMIQGAAQAARGEFDTAAQKLIPVKMVTDSIKAAQGLEAGKMNEQDAVLKVLGFTSARQANLQRELGQEIGKAVKKKDERNDIIGDYVDATTVGERTKVLARMKAYNDSLPKNSMKLTKSFLEKLRLKEKERYKD